MSKQFAMFKSIRSLENYLNIEYYNLNRMKTNPNVTESFFLSKVDHYNGLVKTLNDLFSSLSEFEGEEDLFNIYHVDSYSYEDESMEEDYEDLPTSENLEVEEFEETNEEEIDEVVIEKEDCTINEDGELDCSVDVEGSKNRANDALREYEENSERDISEYDPEEDEPINIRDEMEDGSEDIYDDEYEKERPTENLDYLNHTANNVMVDDDPTQIAKTETTVEIEGDKNFGGTDLDLDDFYEDSFADNDLSSDITEEEIAKLREENKYSEEDIDE